MLVRVEAAPINPSDLGALLAGCDIAKGKSSGSEDKTVFQAPISPLKMEKLSSRINRSMPVGNEGAGVVIAAGKSDGVQAMIGKTVGMIGGSMYSEYRTLSIQKCLLMNDGVSSRDAAETLLGREHTPCERYPKTRAGETIK